MRLQQDQGTGFTAWISAYDTYEWARTPGSSWPCSTLSGRRLMVCFDSNGLCDLTVDGRDDRDTDSHELNAIITDLVGAKLDKDNVAWFVAVGQFKARELEC